MLSKSPPSKDRAALLSSLANDLRMLSMLPLAKKEDEARWDDEADKFREKLYSTDKEVAAELPGELEHYLTDTDIRLKDQAYRTLQDQFVSKLVLTLEGK